MLDDSTLLRRYLDDRSEVAFAELVRRHLDVVYSTALRELRGDFARAQDVAQQVFTRLVRKAPTLRDRASLAGWLHISVRYAAADLRRSEQRRQNREQEAHAMHEQSTSSPASENWTTLEPILNDVVGELSEHDREAVLLRFYHRRRFTEISAILRLSEDAVQKRVERALDKMRARLVKRGITSTSAAVAVMLQNNSVIAAPAGLAGTITAGALTATGAGSGAFFMAIGKLQVSVVTGLVIAGVTTITLQHRRSAELSAKVATLQRENQQIAALRAERDIIRAELDTLNAEHDENLRLRGELDQMRATKPAQIAAHGTSAPAATEPMRSVTALHNVGNATPSAALESLIWAKENLDIPTLSKLFALTPDVRKKLEEIFSDFPEVERTKHGVSTPEQMLAFFFAGLAKPFSGLQIVDQREIDSDNTAFRVVLQLRDGGMNRPEFVLHRAADGRWQWMTPAGLVDELPGELKKLDASK